MWIIPKNLHTSDFVPDTAALSLDSTESSEICARSLFVRSKPSPARTWSQKWKRDSWTRHLYGRILKPSHGQTFVTAWTSSLVATPASPSAQPVNDSAQKTLGTSGHLSQTEFGFSDPSSAFLKMSKDTYPSDSAKSLESWEQSVTRRRGEYSLRLKSARLTSASGSLSWPTVRASDCHNSPTSEQSGERYAQLRSAVSWPTATSRDWKGAYSQESHQKKNRMSLLPDMVAHWPTPTVQEAGKIGNQANHGQLALSNHPAIRGEVSRDKYEKGKHGQAAPANPSTLGSRQGLWTTPTPWQQDESAESWEARKAKNKAKGYNGNGQGTPLDMQVKTQSGKLNPRWVETLMGLPIGWVMPSCKSPATIAPTNSASSATESSLPPQSELF